MGRSALLRHPLAIAGVVITTASAVVFIALAIAMVAGMLVNPYAGLVVFVAIPAVFLMGLVLIPVGTRLQRLKLAREGGTPEWPIVDFRRKEVRRASLAILALTCVNIVIILLAGYGSLHWMESPNFCGQVCHTPMEPQFTSWSAGVHGRVACVECHVGEGASGMVHAKLGGVRQLALVATGGYPRPIPPGADMIEDTQEQLCAGCHKPGHPIADKIKVIREYADDDKNTETMTVLQMLMSVSSSSERAIHWHADPSVTIEYVATDATRATIPYVKVTRANGQVKEFRAPDTTDQAISAGERHNMDCMDCHNTVGHPIEQTPERAVDSAIAAAAISHDLPFVRREGVRLLKETYADQGTGIRAIEEGLTKFYSDNPEGAAAADPAALRRSIAGLQDVYRHNVFPSMGVTWGTYPTNRGHMTSDGCFRCHDDTKAASDGTTISQDCEYCHKQIEQPAAP